MPSKRKLKKRITDICADLATDILIASNYESVNPENVSKIITSIAELQQNSLSHVTFSFDKTPRDFDNRAEYNRARNAYIKAAYKRLRDDFAASATEIVKEMNLSVPADVREAVVNIK